VNAPVLAIDRYRNNGELIAAVAQLGYLRREHLVLDATHGKGVWWRVWRPERLIAHDLDPAKAPDGPADFTALPYCDGAFDAVTLDGPYKLNGRPTRSVDEPYGVHVRARWQDRMDLCERGIDECARVVKPGGVLLVKGQDQVVSGAVRWQTRIFADRAEDAGCTLVDRLDYLSYRPQPAARPCSPCGGLGVRGDLGRCGACDGNGEVATRQVHARRMSSTLLVFRKQ
jgi:hypothetical protein